MLGNPGDEGESQREGLSSPGSRKTWGQGPGCQPTLLPDPPGCWAQEWLPHPLPQLSLVASFMFHPTLWLKAPALGGGQISPSHGRGPGKLQGEQGPGCRRSVGRGQNSRTPCNYGLGRFPRSVLTPCLFQRAHSLRGIVGWYTGPRVLTRLRAPGHTPSISLSPPPHSLQGTRHTHRAGYPERWPGNTHARPPFGRKQTAHAPPAGTSPGTVLTESRTCTHRPPPRLGGR